MTPLFTKDLKERKDILNKIIEIENKEFKRTSLNKTITDSITGIEIKTEYANYLEYPESNYHSYTFAVVNTPENGGLENVFLSLQDDGAYKEFLAHYDVTEAEIELMNTGQYVDLENKITIVELNNNSFSSATNNKVYWDPETMCLVSSTWIEGNLCSGTEEHTYTEWINGAQCNGITKPSNGFYHNYNISCMPSSTGGNPNTSSNNPSNGPQSGAGGTNTPQDETAVVTCNSRDSDCIEVEDDDCLFSDEDLNALYSTNSPFNVDLSEVRDTCDIITTPENDKFMCIYKKLTGSPSFKTLFVDTFGEENSEMNVKFELVTLSNPNAAGSCTLDPNNPTEITITLNKSRINNQHPLTTASDIIHEAIHAFLKYKAYECNGEPIISLNNQNLSEVLNGYNYDCTLATNEHNLIFDNLAPTMTNMLAEVLNDLVASNDMNYFYNFWWNSDPNAEAETWNWLNYTDSTGNELEGCLYYMSLVGLDGVSEFNQVINSNSRHNFLYNKYNTLINNQENNQSSLFDFSTCD